jgi:hypothetical protein
MADQYSLLAGADELGILRVRSIFHTVIRAVSAKNISRHANAHYHPPPSSDRVRDHRMRHLLPHALRRVLCPLADRTVIQAKR